MERFDDFGQPRWRTLLGKCGTALAWVLLTPVMLAYFAFWRVTEWVVTHIGAPGR